MNHKLSITIAFILLLLTGVNAQDASKGKTEITQMRIMVFPWVKKDEDRKAAFDGSSSLRIGIAKINEAFQKRGANLVDFDAFLQNLDENKSLNKAAGNQQDFNSMVLGSSAADIYVGAEIIPVDHGGNKNSVTVILNAYQAGTSKSMASKTGYSPYFQTNDIGLLTMKAMDTVTVDFLNLIQLAFDRIRTEGQSVNIEFSLDGNSSLTFDSDIPPNSADSKMLSEIVKGWVKKNAVGKKYNFQGTVGKKMIFSDVRLPLKDPADADEDYIGDNIFRDISKYLKTMGIKVRREISTNNKLLITIL